MFINKHLWFALGLSMANVLGNNSACLASDQVDRVPRVRPTPAHDLLSDRNINLGESRDITDEILDFSSRAFAKSFNKAGLTAAAEFKLGSIYAQASDYAKTETTQQEFLLESIRHYLNAADQGRADALIPIALFLEALEAKGDGGFLTRIDPEEKLGDVVIALFKLAADCDVPDAETAYKDRSSSRNSSVD